MVASRWQLRALLAVCFVTLAVHGGEISPVPVIAFAVLAVRGGESSLVPVSAAGHSGLALGRATPPSDRKLTVMVLSYESIEPGILDFMYEPIWSTLRAGFEAAPSRSQFNLVFAKCTTVQHSDVMLAKLQPGDFFLWVALSHVRLVNWKQLKSRGVYTVYYRSELIERCVRQSAGIVETWEYTHVNAMKQRALACNRSGDAAILRYLPPGYISVTQPLLRTVEEPLGEIAFIGYFQRRRHACAARIVANHSNEISIVRRTAWDDKSFTSLMARNLVHLYYSMETPNGELAVLGFD
ncbi:hypothetical protein T492DRAFT_838800 [Pavlovales sp. CCMP2436]|nr:hypothetical protein T492DRAFT_838800 [Pavlovales sp. CCMP2436]